MPSARSGRREGIDVLLQRTPFWSPLEIADREAAVVHAPVGRALLVHALYTRLRAGPRTHPCEVTLWPATPPPDVKPWRLTGGGAGASATATCGMPGN